MVKVTYRRTDRFSYRSPFPPNSEDAHFKNLPLNIHIFFLIPPAANLSNDTP